MNNCFATIFPQVDDPDRGAIKYEASIAANPEETGEGVIVHPLTDSEGKEVEEAEEITRLIQTLKKENPGASIAILARARTHLKEIVGQLHSADIKFRAEEIDPLTTRPAILDLLSLMRALLSYSNRIAWLSILRAPWCGLSLEDLHHLCARDPSAPVWELLNNKEITARLSPDGQHRAKKLTAVLTKVFDFLPQSNFRHLLEACWLGLGGPACLSGDVSDTSLMDDAMVFFDKVEEVLSSGETENLHNFERILQSMYASPAAGDDEPVQIMTMHKAKGLEFDFVILPGLGKKGMSDKKRLLLWMPHGSDILMAPMKETGGSDSLVHDFLTRLDKSKSYYESFRILYVSATRAKKQLHLFGHTRQKEDGLRPQTGSPLKHLWPYIEPEWSMQMRQKPPATDIEERTDEPRIQIGRLPSDFKMPAPHPDIETGPAPELSDEQEERPPFEWAGSTARCLGNVLHQCFRDIAEQGLDQWNDEKLKKLESPIKSALLGQGLSITESESACRLGMEALKNIMDDETGRWILANHKEADAEYGLTRADGKNFVSRRIDRTFIDENNVRWIIDYKTGKHEGADLDNFFEDEKERYRSQMEQYEKLIKLTEETRPIKKALYYPLHRRLVEF